MKIQLKSKPQPGFEKQYDWVSERFGLTAIRPLGMTTMQYPSGGYLMCENEFGRGLCYVPVSIFDVCDRELPSNWVLYLYGTHGSLPPGDRCDFYVGLEGLHDESFVERVMDQETEECVQRFRRITTNFSLAK